MSTTAEGQRLSFKEALHVQRMDDHRLYHRSRINQTLHFLSALCFLSAYVLIFVEPVAAVLIGWLLAMVLRQSGHFFFEPKGYDEVNAMSHSEKEAVKPGYNLFRKAVLLSLWALAPAVLWLAPGFFGVLEPATDVWAFARNTSILWLTLGVGAIGFRVLQLFVVRDVQTGLVWAFKILTDPFHDVRMYYRSPLRLLRGERLDPMTEHRPAHS